MLQRSITIAEHVLHGRLDDALSASASLVLRATTPHRGTLVDEMLHSVRSLKQQGQRFERAALVCNETADWAAGRSRALLLRALLTLLDPRSAQLILEAPAGAEPVLAQLRALEAPLSKLFGAGRIAIEVRTSAAPRRPPELGACA